MKLTKTLSPIGRRPAMKVNKVLGQRFYFQESESVFKIQNLSSRVSTNYTNN